MSALLAKYQRERKFSGARASCNGLWVIHLFFVDDILLFVRTSNQECKMVRYVLQRYDESSGQKINFEKSILLFSGNTSFEKREAVKEMFGVRAIIGLEKYLGLPTMVGRGKKKAFRDLKNKIAGKLSSWVEEFCQLVEKRFSLK